MKKNLIVTLLPCCSMYSFAQNGFDCDMRYADTLLTPTEKCIVNCIKQLPIEKNLGKKNIRFFDSLFNCSDKNVILRAERSGYYYTTIVFTFSDNLSVRFYVAELKYGSKNLYRNGKKWDPSLARKEIPFKVKIFYSVYSFCELGKL